MLRICTKCDAKIHYRTYPQATSQGIAKKAFKYILNYGGSKCGGLSPARAGEVQAGSKL